MPRVKFENGKQREFLNKVMLETNVPSLRSLSQYGFDVSYSSWKNYYNENRCLHQSLFENLCHIAKLNPKNFKFKLLNDYWGQVKGGKKSRK
ncbi:hypothetical protein COU57_02070 [Candidatus Pacearchaeota archaeon CG10_big_fil_rev_8_21_14_0_10_32_14]|nr:MAG: hypothetical protein COU57_02070 [Candidatus Pacearchaeota archaeon CG10_big_fil_rev_8_21_14_0_10_32_14]